MFSFKQGKYKLDTKQTGLASHSHLNSIMLTSICIICKVEEASYLLTLTKKESDRTGIYSYGPEHTFVWVDWDQRIN